MLKHNSKFTTELSKDNYLTHEGEEEKIVKANITHKTKYYYQNPSTNL